MDKNKGTYIDGNVRYTCGCPLCRGELHVFISKKSGEIAKIEGVKE